MNRSGTQRIPAGERPAVTSFDGQEEPCLAVVRSGAGDERATGRRAMLGDAAVPVEPVEQERLRGAVERAGGIGRDVIQILEKFYVNGQDAIPRPPPLSG